MMSDARHTWKDGARPFYRGTFTVWSVNDGSTQGARDRLSVTSLPEAENRISEMFGNKETIFILETDEIAGWSVLHTYRVRLGKAQWRNVGGVPTKVAPKTAERIGSIRVEAFEPKEPWRWTPGCDVVGRGDNVMEAR